MPAASLALTTHSRARLTTPLLLAAVLPLVLLAAPAMAGEEPVLLIEDTFANTPIRPVDGYLDRTPAEYGDVVWEADHAILMGRDMVTNLGSPGVQTATVRIDNQGYPFAELTVEAEVDPTDTEHVGLGFTKVRKGRFDTKGQVWISLAPTGDVRLYANGTAILLYQGLGHPDFSSGANRLALRYHLTTGVVRAWLNDSELPIPQPQLAAFGFEPDPKYVGFYSLGNEGKAIRYGSIDSLVVKGGDGLAILQDPLPWTAVAGTSADFWVIAGGGTPPYSYQWKAKPDGSSTWSNLTNGGDFEGASSQTLTIGVVDPQEHQGEYKVVVRDQVAQEALWPISQPARLVVIPAEVADHFTNGGRLRSVGAKLDGVTAEVGARSWVATTGLGFGAGYIRNTTTASPLIGNVPFEFSEAATPDYRYASVEAWVHAPPQGLSQCLDGWRGVGFSSSASGSYATDGQVWAFLAGGLLHVRANGSAHSLLGSSSPHPEYVDGWNYLKIRYDRVFNRVEVWLNQVPVELTVDDLDTFSFTPTISHAGFHGNCGGPYEVPDGFMLDSFAAAYDGLIGQLVAAVDPPSLTVQRNHVATFAAEVSGGLEPYAYQWQRWDGGAGVWVDMADGPLVSGTTSDVLTMSGVAPSAATDYRVWVTDSGLPEQQVSSPPATLVVANATYGCFSTEPRLADFGILLGGWTAHGMDLQDYGSSAHFVTGENGTYIASGSPVPVPAGYTRVELTMKSAGEYTIGCRFWWGDTAADSRDFDLAPSNDPVTVVLDLKGTTFAEVSAPTGIALRNLKISFTTPNKAGDIWGIDAFPGGRLRFSGDPKLLIGDLEATSFAVGATMDLRQTVQNIGCDMGFWDNSEERDVTFTLCRADSPTTCAAAFEQCNPDPESKQPWRGHVTFHGALGSGLQAGLSPCTIELPPGLPENIGAWVLRGIFDDDPTKPATEKTINLVERGIPNLVVERYVTFEAKQDVGAGLERSSFLDARFPFDLFFAGVSYYYPMSDVPVRVWVRPHDPGEELGEEGWVMVANRHLPSLGGGEDATVTGISVAALLPRNDRYWTLLDVRVALDPDDEIDELGYESDNEYTVYDFIPVAIADGDLGKAIGAGLNEDGVVEFDDGLVPPFATFNLSYGIDETNGIFGAQYAYAGLPRDELPERKPVLYWSSATTTSPVSGVMVRYKRDGNAPPAFLDAATWGESTTITGSVAYGMARGDDSGTAPTSASVDLVGNNQWHTVVLKTGGRPFQSFAAKSLHEHPDLGTATQLGIAFDSSSVYGNFPFTSLDFIRVWTDDDPQPASPDADPNALVFQDQGGTWYPLTVAGPHAMVKLGVHVVVHGEVTLTSDNVTATMLVDVVGAYQEPELTPGTHVEAATVAGRPGQVVSLNVEGQEMWEVQEGFSSAQVTVTLVDVPGEGLVEQGNNVETFFVDNIQKSNGAGDDVLPQEAKGYQSSGYDLSKIENVNLANGNLTLAIPLCSLASDAGLSYDLTLVYNSKLWSYQSWLDPDPGGEPPPWPGPGPDQLGAFEARGVPSYGLGWDLRPPHVTVDHQRRFETDETAMLKLYSWVDASGASHELYSKSLADAATCTVASCRARCDFSITDACYTWDGSNLRATPVCSMGPPGPAPGDVCVAVNGVDVEDGTGVVYRHRYKVEPFARADKRTLDFADDVPGFYLTSLESGPWQGGEPTNRIRFSYEEDAWDADTHDNRFAVRLAKVEVVDVAGATAREVNLAYQPQTAAYGGAGGALPMLVLSEVTYPSSTGEARVAISYESLPVHRPDGKDLDSLFSQMPFLAAVTHLQGQTALQTYAFHHDNLASDGVSKGLLSGMTLPSGAEVSYAFGNYPVWKRRCDMEQYNAECQPGGAGETWCSGGDFPEDSASVETTGVKQRSIRFEDAATASNPSTKLETTRFRQHVACGGCPYPSGGCVDNYSGGAPQPDDDYLWTWVETFAGEEPPGVRSAEIHRFHPRTYKEVSVDVLDPFGAWALGGADPVSTLDDKAEEPLADQLAWPEVRVAQHTYRRWQMKYPSLKTNPIRYDDPSAFVEVVKVLTDGGGTVGSSDVRDCHLAEICDELIISTPEVNEFLQPEHSTVTGGDAQAGTRVERYTETTYDSLDEESGYGVHWYVPRPVEVHVRPTADFDCEGSRGGDVACQTTTWDWDTVPLAGSNPPPAEFGYPSPLRMVRATLNPTGVELDQCSGDCQEKTYQYLQTGQHAGYLESQRERGGYDAGALTKSLYTVYEYENGRASRKYLSADGSWNPATSLELWRRGVNQRTQRVEWHLDGAGRGFEYLYDALGRLTEFVAVQGSSTSRQVDETEDGVPVRGTHITYAPPGTGTLMTNVIRDVTYDSGDQVGDGTEATFDRASFHFDGLGRTTRVTETFPGATAAERSTFTLRDFAALGRRERSSTWVNGTDFPITESGAHWTEVVVDGLGRPVSVTQPDGSLVTSKYAGNRVTEVTRKVATSTTGEESDVVTRSVTDPLGRVRRVVEDASGHSYTLDHSYDVADRLTRVWDSDLGKEVARFQYSPGGYLLEAWDRDRRTVFDGYNDLGSVTRETTDTGTFDTNPMTGAQQTVLGYDPVGRLATKTVGSDLVLTMTYGWDQADPSYGKPLTAAQVNEHDGADVTVTQAWTYDGPGGSVSGRATTVTSSLSTRFDLAYGHDPWGNVSRVVAPDGAVTTAVFDANWLTSATWVGAAAGLTDFTYLANGRVRRQRLGTYLSLLETEDASGMARPGAIVLNQGGSPLWLGESYAFDGSGNLKAAGAKQYAYDGLGRLTMRQIGSTVDDYAFDRWGNLESLPRADGESVALVAEGDSNRLSTIDDGQAQPAPVSYDDPRGNVTSLPAIGGAPVLTLTYSGEDRLLTAKAGEQGPTWSYAYDAAGERVAAWAGTSWTFFARDEAGQVVSELTGLGSSATVTRSYLSAGGRLFGQHEPSTGVQYVVQDYLGSTRALVPPSGGSLTATYDYEPYGELPSGSSAATKRLFTSHERDAAETGLDYMHARYYTAGGGRFLSVDPVGGSIGSSQSWNRYSYVQNNPLNFVDPDGRLQRKKNGELREHTLGTATATHVGDPGREYKVRVVNLLADDGSKVDASTVKPKGSDRSPGDILDAATGKRVAKDTGPSNPMATNCHGTTFADGKFAIDNSQVSTILKGDNYSQVTGGAALGDVAIYREGGDVVHSARVDTLNPDGSAATVVGLGGLETTTSSLPVGPGQGAAWSNSSATVEYWRQSGAE